MNTDAEGRLVLADGLIDASAQKPELDHRRRHPDRRGETALAMITTRCSALTMRWRIACWRALRRKTSVLASAAGRVPPATSCRPTLLT